MSNRNRRYSKRELLGSLYVDYVLSVQDLGLSSEADRWEILREFLRTREGRAERLIEEPGGFLVLQSVVGQADSGGIYAYNESLRAFFWLQFEVKDGSLNGRDFDYAVRVYHLLRFLVNANKEGRSRKRKRGGLTRRFQQPSVATKTPSYLPPRDLGRAAPVSPTLGSAVPHPLVQH